MTRQEERHHAAIKEFPHFAERRVGFIAGAEWADANPDGKMLLHVLNKSAEQAKKQMIDKACEWLKENKNRYVYNKVGYGNYIPTCSNQLIEDFRKAMKE